MIFRLAVRKTIFVSFISQKLGLRLQLKVAVFLFFINGRSSDQRRTNKELEKFYELGLPLLPISNGEGWVNIYSSKA